MDEFQALLAKRSGDSASAPPAEDEDEFSAVLAKRGKPADPATTPAGEIPRGSPYTAPPATTDEPGSIGRLMRGKNLKEAGQYAGATAADVADIGLGGIPAMLLGTIGEVTQRASSLVDGRGYREGGKAGAEFSRSMGERFGRPLFDSLVAAGLLNKETRSIPMQAMDKIGGFLEHAATVVEHDTGGAISKEDYLASVNGFMAAMGVKGLKAMTQAPLNRAAARGQKTAWDSALERFDAEEQLARAKFEEGTPNRTAAKAAAERPADDGLYGGDFAQQAVARREAFLRRKTYEKDLSNFPPSGERTGSRGPVDLTLEGKETPTTYTGNQPFSTADQTAALKRGVVSPSPIETEGALRPAARPALDTALEKVRGGRLFDMTAEERIAIRNSVDITDPKVITAAAVGATGLGLAMAYEPSAEEAAMAIGAGALLRRGGEGLLMRELLAKPEATPLGALLESSAYTTSTLEKLADSSPGRFEFKKSAVEQLLKREGVTKHERDLMTAVLAEVPRDTVTAKELMVGLKLATKDFELTPAKSDSYANYGLERIDRDPGIRRDLAQQFGVEPETNPLEAMTRVYRSPLELGSNNHFQDPNYFAHTRSFVEDGVRHVVELQSDLAQKAGKPPTLETIAKAKEQLAVNEALDAAWGDVQYGVSRAGNYSFFDGLQRFFKREPELNRILGHEDQKLMLEDKLWRSASQSTDPTLQRLTEEFHANWEKTATPQIREGYAQGWVDISDGFAEWLIKHKDQLTDRSETTLRYTLQELANRNTQEALVGISEAKSKLEAGASTQVAPMLKDWHKRLVREELADAARNLEQSVRFATADTVAKVEGWPDVHERITDSITQNESNLASHKQTVAALEAIKRGEVPDDPYYYALRTADPEGFQSVVKNIETELTHAREALTASEERLARAKENWAGQTRFSKEHQGIYDRYSRDVEKFLRQLGAQPYTDSAGHTWLEVPLGEQQKTLPGGGARTQLGGVDARFLAKAVFIGSTIAVGTQLDKKHPIVGGVLGYIGGALITSGLIGKIGKAMWEMRKPEKTIRIDEAGNQYDYTIARAQVTTAQIANAISKLVPDRSRREAVTKALDSGNPVNLKADEMTAYKAAKKFFEGFRDAAIDAKVMKEFKENYVTHLWDFEGNTNKLASPGMSPGSRFAKQRTFTSIADGIAAGYKPLTKDISEIIDIYGNSMGRSIANRQLLDTLRSAKTKDGVGLVVEPKDAPHGYTTFNTPQFREVLVHPDIVPSLKFLYESPSLPAAVRAAEVLNSNIKRLAVGFSLFHAKALLDAAVGAKGLGAFKTALESARGQNAYLKELRDIGVGPNIDMALKGGLKLSLEGRVPGVEDVNQGFYEGMRAVQKFADASLPGSGRVVEGYIKANHAFDTFMWARLQTGLKLQVFGEKYETLLKNAPKMSREQAATIAASFSNDMFGGLNWRRIAEGVQNRFGREIALAMLSPEMRRVNQLLLFAPDWTLSTTRAFVKAIGPGSLHGSLPDALGGTPKTLADLHRQYLVRSALYYLAAGTALNMYFSGKPLWENKDWTRIDMGDGRTMQWSKHTMEPIHWLQHPGQQALNKLGYIPKEGMSQVFGVEYLNPHVDKRGTVVAGPKMGESRLVHAVKGMGPIAGQQLGEGGADSALAGMLGVPIYGKTERQKEREKAQRDIGARP